MNATQTTNPPTTAQWLAQVLRSFADQLDPSSMVEPTLQQVRQQKLRAAQFALLEAEAEEERSTNTVAMLRARVRRLQQGDN